MTATVPDYIFSEDRGTADSIKGSLDVLETMFQEVAEHAFDAEFFERLGEELRRLHARIRMHHAADFVQADSDAVNSLPPEFSGDMSRLRDEHAHFLGALDRLIRRVDSMADQTLEDKEVFVLRGKELIAMLRRHEAEEDRLFYLAVWRDTGGES